MNTPTPIALAVSGVEILPIVIRDQRVLTFAQIDKVHARPEGTAKRNFSENRERLTDGEDYFRVSPDEIRTTNPGTISEAHRSDLTVVTESGYLLLVKSFTDDLAWRIQKELVKAYFRLNPERTVPPGNTDQPAFRRSPLQAEMFDVPANPVKLTGIFCANLKLAKALGQTGDEAILTADAMTKKLTGFSALALADHPLAGIAAKKPAVAEVILEDADAEARFRALIDRTVAEAMSQHLPGLLHRWLPNAMREEVRLNGELDPLPDKPVSYLTPTDALASVGSYLSANVFTKNLERIGWLENRAYINPDFGPTKYRVLVGEGLKYGANLRTHPANIATTPLYDAAKFREMHDRAEELTLALNEEKDLKAKAKADAVRQAARQAETFVVPKATPAQAAAFRKRANYQPKDREDARAFALKEAALFVADGDDWTSFLLNRGHILSQAFTEAEVESLKAAYDRVFPTGDPLTWNGLTH